MYNATISFRYKRVKPSGPVHFHRGDRPGTASAPAGGGRMRAPRSDRVAGLCRRRFRQGRPDPAGASHRRRGRARRQGRGRGAAVRAGRHRRPRRDRPGQAAARAGAGAARQPAGRRQADRDPTGAGQSRRRAGGPRQSANRPATIRGAAQAQERRHSVQIVDQQRADLRSADAKVQALRGGARANARPDGARAARSRRSRPTVEAAHAAVAMAQWRLDQRHVGIAGRRRASPTCWRRPGETLPAGAPVVSLLPPENIFVRFFVPEPMLAQRPSRRPGRARLRQLSGRSCRRPSPSSRRRPNTRRRSSTARRAAPSSSTWWRRARRRDAGASCSIRASRSSCDRSPNGCSRDDRLSSSTCTICSKSFGTRRVVDGLSLQVAQGRDLRLSRRQWQRQDHHHPHAVRAAGRRRRQRHLPRLRHHPRGADRSAARSAT